MEWRAKGRPSTGGFAAMLVPTARTIYPTFNREWHEGDGAGRFSMPDASIHACIARASLRYRSKRLGNRAQCRECPHWRDIRHRQQCSPSRHDRVVIRGAQRVFAVHQRLVRKTFLSVSKGVSSTADHGSEVPHEGVVRIPNVGLGHRNSCVHLDLAVAWTWQAPCKPHGMAHCRLKPVGAQELSEGGRYYERPQRRLDGALRFVHFDRKLIDIVE